LCTAFCVLYLPLESIGTFLLCFEMARFLTNLTAQTDRSWYLAFYYHRNLTCQYQYI